MAASTFLEILSIWKTDADADIASKIKFAKYHALRILKAIKANQDPNATNPVQEPKQQPAPPVLDPTDPEVQSITQDAPQQPLRNPYQPYVESAPDVSAQPSPAFSAPKASPPPNLPAVPTGYTQSAHNDVSPMSQPASSRKGSVASIGGGYFPRTDPPPPPTFSAENAAPNLPTASSSDHETLATPMGDSSLTQAAGASDPSSFYQNPASPPPTVQPTHNPYQSPTYTSPPPPQQPPVLQSNPTMPQQHQYSAPTPQPPPQQQYSSPAPRQNPYAQPAAPPPPATTQGPFRDDEDSLREAKKHAKWAISAIDFDDANTAVKELRVALRALGAL